MHVRVRWAGREVIVALPSRLSKVEALRRLLSDKLAVPIQNQRLFYGGKLLEDGYTFHDYSIKLNDVIQLMSKIVDNKIQEEKCTKTANGNGHVDNSSSDNEQQKKIAEYEDSFSELYKIGDLVDMKDSYIGWVEGKVVTILRKIGHLKKIKKDLDNIENSISSRLNGDVENISPKRRIPKSNENKSPNSPKSLENRTHDDEQKTPSHKSPTTPNTKRGIRHYFSPTTPGHSNDTKSESKTRSKKLKPDESQTEEKKECIENNLANIIEDEEANLLFRIQLSDEDDVTDCKLSQIRPRARKVIEVENVNLNETVMVNYNSEQPHEKGYWYDFTIHEVKKQRKHIELYGSLYQGNIVLNDVKVRHHDKIYCIESIIPLSKRTKELEEIMKTETERRTRPLNCTTCRDKQDAKCKDCGCFICAGKNNPDQIILCDECNMGFHLTCLDPQLTQLPEDDWYCLQCRRDPNEVVAPGQGKQQRKTVQSKSARDWGRGMACVGKTQTCAMPANHFGPIPGIEVGMAWRFRIQLSESGVHRPPVSGIHGRDVDGAYSIVLSGGYEDDVDNGFEFTYTGSGGRDLSGNKRTADQSSDQTLTRENKALAKNCAVNEINEEGGDAKEKWRDGKPVRVVRSYKMLKHFPEYAPKEGIRYDGIYKVVKYYPETGKAGFRVWKYLLRRDDPNPAPWEKNAKQFSIVYPDGYLEAEAEKQALKEKERNKNGQKRKRVLKECNGAIEIETNDKSSKNKKKAKSDSPPPKRMKTRSSISNGNDDQKEAVKTKIEKSITPKSTKKNKPVQKSPNSSVNPFTLAATKKEKSSPQNENIKPDEVLSKDNKEAIEKDVLNKKLWNECLTSLSNEGKQGFINNVTKLFLCIICQDLAANPTTTSCGHNFCMVCLKLAFKSTHSKNCPCCRADLSKEEPAHNDLLKVALRAIMPGYDSGKK